MEPSKVDPGRFVHKTQFLGKYNPELKDVFDIDGAQKVFPVPCGNCIGCRLDQSRRWADRMMLEYDHSKKAVFVTLTYNDDYVPKKFYSDGSLAGYSLSKRDLQKWLKRLRKRYEDLQIRYYAVGEYGSSTFRPHYHVILFGISLSDFSDLVPFSKNELGQLSYISQDFAKTWSEYDPKSHSFVSEYGFHLLTDISWEACAYVARYVQKKVYGSFSDWCELRGLEPEFSLMSRDPGIGAFYAEDHPDCFDFQNFHVAGYHKPIPVPKYLLKKLSCFDPEKYDSIVMTRQEFMNDRELLKFQSTDLSFAQQLELEEDLKLKKAKCLRRGKV